MFRSAKTADVRTVRVADARALRVLSGEQHPTVHRLSEQIVHRRVGARRAVTCKNRRVNGSCAHDVTDRRDGFRHRMAENICQNTRLTSRPR